MRINHSMGLSAGLNANYAHQRSSEKTLQKLSTGMRINRASDDAAGIAVSEKLRTQVRGAAQARKNAEDGISLLTIADGGAGEITSIIQRMRELAVQAATDTVSSSERTFLQAEYSQLYSEIDRIAECTKFNSQSLLSGTSGFGTDGKSYMHIGANAEGSDGIEVSYGQLKTSDIGLADQMLSGTFSFSGNFGAFGSVSAVISFDGTSNTRGTLVSASSGGTYNPAAAGTPVTSIEFYDSSMTPVSVREFLKDSSKVAYVGAEFSSDTVPKTTLVNGVPVTTSIGVGWREWQSAGGGSYAPDGGTDSNGAVDRPVTDISTQTGAADAIFKLDSALNTTSRVRANIGAYINRLSSSVNNLMTSETSQQSAESQIRDADFASEASEFTRQQILTQSSVSMIAQANANRSQILTLLQR